jgi:hypothetical protein
LKLLLGRGKVLSKAPWGYQFDAYRNRLKRTWRPGGHGATRCSASGCGWAGRQLRAHEEHLRGWRMSDSSLLQWSILLERARWAPSGDNTQPWRFEVVGRGAACRCMGSTRAIEVVYDFRRAGEPACAWCTCSRRCGWRRVGPRLAGRMARFARLAAERTPIYDVVLVPDATIDAPIR